jgi:hypothetical protein
MFRLFGSAAVVIALVAAAPAWAQVYKWVDDKGVVNYSSRPPVDRKSALLDPNSVSVSTYTPRELPREAAKAAPSASERVLAERIAALERKLDAERAARQSIEYAQARHLEQRADQCLRDRRVDCDFAGADSYYAPYYAPYWTTVVVSRPHPHFRPRPPIRPAPRLTPSRPAFAPARTPPPAGPTT